VPLTSIEVRHPPDKFAVSDENGKFVFSGVPEGGIFSLVACRQGYHAWVGAPHTGDVLRIVLKPKAASPRTSN
jgi:hypothetical protein